MTAATRRRDPERRRREIVSAAAALVLEQGPDALTHRKVAARAGVPLGSTTQYFATLDDLRAAALRSLVDEAEQWLVELEEGFVRDGASPSAFTAALHRYVSDPQLVRGDFAMTCAAAASDELSEVDRHWASAFLAALERYLPTANARALSTYSDGIAMAAAVRGEVADRDEMERAVTALWNM